MRFIEKQLAYLLHLQSCIKTKISLLKQEESGEDSLRDLLMLGDYVNILYIFLQEAEDALLKCNVEEYEMAHQSQQSPTDTNNSDKYYAEQRDYYAGLYSPDSSYGKLVSKFEEKVSQFIAGNLVKPVGESLSLGESVSWYALLEVKDMFMSEIRYILRDVLPKEVISTSTIPCDTVGYFSNLVEGEIDLESASDIEYIIERTLRGYLCNRYLILNDSSVLLIYNRELFKLELSHLPNTSEPTILVSRVEGDDNWFTVQQDVNKLPFLIDLKETSTIFKQAPVNCCISESPIIAGTAIYENFPDTTEPEPLPSTESTSLTAAQILLAEPATFNLLQLLNAKVLSAILLSASDYKACAEQVPSSCTVSLVPSGTIQGLDGHYYIVSYNPIPQNVLCDIGLGKYTLKDLCTLVGYPEVISGTVGLPKEDTEVVNYAGLIFPVPKGEAVVGIQQCNIMYYKKLVRSEIYPAHGVPVIISNSNLEPTESYIQILEGNSIQYTNHKFLDNNIRGF